MGGVEWAVSGVLGKGTSEGPSWPNGMSGSGASAGSRGLGTEDAKRPQFSWSTGLAEGGAGNKLINEKT